MALFQTIPIQSPQDQQCVHQRREIINFPKKWHIFYKKIYKMHNFTVDPAKARARLTEHTRSSAHWCTALQNSRNSITFWVKLT